MEVEQAATMPQVANGGDFPRGRDDDLPVTAAAAVTSDRRIRQTGTKRSKRASTSVIRKPQKINLSPLVRSERAKVPAWLQVGDLQPGTLLLGCVVTVRPEGAVILLPYGIWGICPLAGTEALERSASGAPTASVAVASTLKLQPQTIVRACVLSRPLASHELEPERRATHQSGKRERSIHLSVDPRHVNRGLGLSERLADYGPIQVRLSLPLDDAQKRFTVEALAEDPSQDRRLALQVSGAGATASNDTGMVCWASLASWNEQRRTGILQNDPKMVAEAFTRGHWTLEQLSPGMLVEAQVLSRDERFAIVRFLQVFEGILEWFHLDQWEDFARLEPDAILRVRLIYIDCRHRRIMVTARTSLVNTLTLPLLVSAARRYHRGSFVESLRVFKIENGRGIWLRKDKEAIYFFADRKMLSDERFSRMERLFPLGTVVPRARVVSHMAMEGIVRVSLKPSLLERKFMDVSELEPGALVRCRVLGWISVTPATATPSLRVSIEDCLSGEIPLELLTDVPVQWRRLEKKFPPGSQLRCRVWLVYPKRKQVLLTARRSLVDSDLPILAGWDTMQQGQVYAGILGPRDPSGAYRVLFYQRFTGILPANLGTEMASLKSGQVIRVRVERIHSRRAKQLLVSLDNSAVTATPMAAAAAAAASEQQSDQGRLRPGTLVRIQSAFRDQVGRILALVYIDEPRAKDAGAQSAKRTWLVLLPRQHLTDYPMFQKSWAADAGLAALCDEVALVIDAGHTGDSSLPLISHRWSLCRAAACGLLDDGAVERSAPGSIGVGYVERIGAAQAYAVVRLGLSSRRVHVQRALLADRFVDQSTSVLLEGQLVLYSVRNGSRYSLRYSDVQPALETEPYREFFQEMRSLVPLVRELARLWRAHEASQSLGLSLPLPGTLVRGRVLYSSDDRMDMEVQHEQVIYRGVVGSYHFVDTQAGEQAPTASRETSTTRAAVGQLCTALVLWMDPLAKTMVLSRKASLLKTAPLPWSDAQCLTATDSTVSSSLGGCTRVQKAQVLAVYGQVAVLLAQARLAFMSTLDINGRGTERPVHVGQQLTVTARTANATARPPPAPAASTPAADDENNGAKNGDDAAEWPAWMRAMLRASVRPAAPSTETAAQSAGVQTKRQVPQPLSRPPVRIGDVVTDAEVTAVHSFQVHVRWSDGQTGRVHIINVENEGAFRELQVGQLLPPARIVAQRRPRQWELSLRQRDLEATDVLSLDSLPQTGDLVERAVVKTTDLNAQGDVLAVWLYVRPGLVARLSRLEATPRVLDESWVPGRFVQGLRVLRADADRKRYDLTTTDPLLAGQCITGARVRSVHPVDGIVRVQLPRGQMGVLFIGCLPYEDPKDPFRTLQGIQKLDVYLVEDWIPSKQVPVTAIPERQPLRWAQLHRGDVVGAFVRHVDQVGVFLNLAPGLVARCLLRDLAEGFVPDPVQVYPVGMHVQAMITDCGGSDARHVRVSLRAAQQQQQQQQQQQRAVAAEQAPTSAVHIGGVYLGRVRRVVPFGIFVELLTDRTDEGDAQVLATALCHRSELVEQGPWPLPEELPQRFRVGQHLPVLVVARDAAGRLSLSAKASLIKEALATQCASAKPIDEVDLGAGFTPALKDVIVSATEDENVAHEPISRSGNCDSPASAATKYAASSLMGSERSPQQRDAMACLGSNTTALDHLEENTETEEMEHTAHHPNGIYAAVNGASAGTLPFLAIPSETELVREDADTHASKDWSRSVDEASGAARAPLDDEALERGERALVESLHKPQTAADFERALLGRPNDPQLWIGYMALHLATGNELEARGIAERALQTIHYREYQARMRVWIAYLNLERSANAAADPLESDIFRRALQNCDSLQLHLRLARSLEAAQEVKLAGRVYEHACRRHGHQTASVWIAYGAFCFLRSSQEVLGRTLLERALRALMDPAQHVQCILKFATFEFKGSGEPERGRTLLENLIQAFPKRLDFWNVYLDMELMLLRQERGKLELVRRLFRRCTALPNLSLKQAKHFFKRYLEVERAFGDASSVEHVKQAARAYVAQRTGEAPQR